MPKQHNALFGNDLHQPKGIGVETTAEYLIISQSLNIISGSAESTGSFGHVLATTFKGDGSSLTGVTAEWDGTHSGNGTITGNFTVSGNISGSSTSTGSFGRVEATKIAGTLTTAAQTNITSVGTLSALTVSANGIDIDDTSASGGQMDGVVIGNSTAVGGKFTTLEASGNISGSLTSTGSFGKVLGDGSQLTGISGFDYTSGSSPVVTTNPSSIGATWINTTSGEIFVCHDITSGENEWLGTAGTEVVPVPLAYFGSRGLFGGSGIQYITIATAGNATTFGTITQNRSVLGSCSNGTKGVFGGGESNGGSNVIDYVTIATTGNAIDFGDLTVARSTVAACSDGTKGLWAGGYASAYTNVIDYVAIATTGNASDFGDLITAREGLGSCSNGTRGIWGGYANNSSIDYVTIATTGNAIDFGNMTVSRYGHSACSDGTKGLWGGGWHHAYPYPHYNTIDYVTIATTGNATDFGDLTVARNQPAACSDGTKGVWSGGRLGASASNTDTIDYVTVATTGNATDFGNLTSAKRGQAGCSG
jgi:hypothetical protein